MSPLKAIRDARGLRRIDVASAAGVAPSVVAKLETGDYASLRLGGVMKVAVALGVAPAELVPGLAARPQTRGASSRVSVARSDGKAGPERPNQDS